MDVTLFLIQKNHSFQQIQIKFTHFFLIAPVLFLEVSTASNLPSSTLTLLNTSTPFPNSRHIKTVLILLNHIIFVLLSNLILGSLASFPVSISLYVSVLWFWINSYNVCPLIQSTLIFVEDKFNVLKSWSDQHQNRQIRTVTVQ